MADPELAHRRRHDYTHIGQHFLIVCDTEGCNEVFDVKLAEDGTAYCPKHEGR